MEEYFVYTYPESKLVLITTNFAEAVNKAYEVGGYIVDENDDYLDF